MRKILAVWLCGLALLVYGCGGSGGGDEAAIRAVAEEFITAYNEGSVYTLQDLCAEKARTAFDMTGETHTDALKELVRASGAKSSFSIVGITQKGKTAQVTLNAVFPSMESVEAELARRMNLLTVTAYGMSDEEMDLHIIEGIVSALKSPRIELDEGEYDMQMVLENGAWKVIPESPPFYLLND